jgi:hypothetical protein
MVNGRPVPDCWQRIVEDGLWTGRAALGLMRSILIVSHSLIDDEVMSRV